MLTHTTAWEQQQGGHETLKQVSIYAAQLCLITFCTLLGFSLPHGTSVSEGDQERIFFTLKTYKATVITFILSYNCRNWKCEVIGRTGWTADGRTDVNVEIVMYMSHKVFGHPSKIGLE